MLYSLSQHFSVADTSLIINKCLLTLSEFSPSVLTKILMAFSSLIGKKPQKTKQLLGKLTDIVLLDLISKYTIHQTTSFHLLLLQT